MRHGKVNKKIGSKSKKIIIIPIDNTITLNRCINKERREWPNLPLQGPSFVKCKSKRSL
jgi:hypothetical protein